MVGAPCDFSVSSSPFGLDFGTLDFGLGLYNFHRGEEYSTTINIPFWHVVGS